MRARCCCPPLPPGRPLTLPLLCLLPGPRPASAAMDTPALQALMQSAAEEQPEQPHQPPDALQAAAAAQLASGLDSLQAVAGQAFPGLPAFPGLVGWNPAQASNYDAECTLCWDLRLGRDAWPLGHRSKLSSSSGAAAALPMGL